MFKLKVSAVVINDDGKILMIKEKVEKNIRPLWNIIKGTYGDVANETIFEAIKRECQEEASIEIEIISTTGCYITNKNNEINLQINFVAKCVKGEPAVAHLEKQFLRGECISEIKWFTKEDILSLGKREFISEKIYTVVHDFLNGDQYSTSVFKPL